MKNRAPVRTVGVSAESKCFGMVTVSLMLIAAGCGGAERSRSVEVMSEGGPQFEQSAIAVSSTEVSVLVMREECVAEVIPDPSRRAERITANVLRFAGSFAATSVLTSALSESARGRYELDSTPLEHETFIQHRDDGPLPDENTWRRLPSTAQVVEVSRSCTNVPAADSWVRVRLDGEPIQELLLDGDGRGTVTVPDGRSVTDLVFEHVDTGARFSAAPASE